MATRKRLQQWRIAQRKRRLLHRRNEAQAVTVYLSLNTRRALQTLMLQTKESKTALLNRLVCAEATNRPQPLGDDALIQQLAARINKATHSRILRKLTVALGETLPEVAIELGELAVAEERALLAREIYEECVLLGSPETSGDRFRTMFAAAYTRLGLERQRA